MVWMLQWWWVSVGRGAEVFRRGGWLSGGGEAGRGHKVGVAEVDKGGLV